MNKLYDAIIIGAGPVGSYLAEKLAHRAHKTLVLDKKSDAGDDVCCTGIVGRDCVDLLGINDDLILRNVDSARLIAPSGKSMRFWRDETVAFVLDRPALNRALAGRAEKAGAEYRLDSLVTNIQVDSQFTTVHALENRRSVSHKARAVVVASGMDSKLPNKVGLGTIVESVIGAQAEIQTGDLGDVEIYLDHERAPGGFAWLVPTCSGRGLAGLIIRGDPKKQLKLLLKYLKDQGKIISEDVSPAYGVVPSRFLPKSYTTRILVVGEAAGQVKPTTGGGIYYGLLCADIALDTLQQAFIAGDFSSAKLASYEKQWHTLLKRELTIGYWAHRLFRVMDNRKIEILLNMMNNCGVQKLIARSDDFSFDWHSKLIFKALRHLILSLPSQCTKGLTRQNTGGTGDWNGITNI